MTIQIKKQAGGTLLGLIIGLIIGLGIAVVVAVMIKNTPLPFINKLAKPDRPDHAAGQASDPNKPLYGNNNASKEAAKEFARRAEEAKTAKEGDALMDAAEKAEAKLDAKADAIPETRPAAKSDGKAMVAKIDGNGDSKAPIGRAPMIDRSAPAKEAGAEKPQKADNADEKFMYYLQAGAFREQTDAENTRAKLALLGFSANIAERPSESGTLYRVRIGPFGQLETMNRMRSKLSDNGVDVATIRVPK